MRTFHGQTIRDPRGFTLVEMLSAILISMLIMAGVTGVFISHSRTASINDDLSTMQEGMRGAMTIMTNEFRIAGCDPLGKQVAGIRRAEPTDFEFTADLGGDSDYPNEADGKINGGGERVAYHFEPRFKDCKRTKRSPNTGVLCRKVMPRTGKWDKADWQELADDIERLEFNYILWDHKEKEFRTSAGEKLQGDDISKISAVQITMLVRGELEDPRFLSDGEFQAGSGKWWKLAEMYDSKTLATERRHRRRLLSTTVQLRNLGGK